MADLILHHYEMSPFAEKVRAILGYKGLAWRSVDIPVVMPKPDLTALTGGYRKTPVLQVGADVYCDTTRIARVLDEIEPARPVFRAEQDALTVPAGRWLDHHLFFSVIALLFDPAAAEARDDSFGGPEAAAAFAKDRGPMIASARVKPPSLADARVVLHDVLRGLDAQLGACGPWLFGESAGWADFCAYHPLWGARRNPAIASQLDAYPHVLAWLDRLAALGHGTPEPLDAKEALEIARASEPRPLLGAPGPTPELLELGERVQVSADDYAFEASEGTLVHCGPNELSIARNDERAGRVVVHFPRIGYEVKPA